MFLGNLSEERKKDAWSKTAEANKHECCDIFIIIDAVSDFFLKHFYTHWQHTHDKLTQSLLSGPSTDQNLYRWDGFVKVIEGCRVSSETSHCCFCPSAAERFIENVLKNVDRQHVDVDNLTPKDLDQLSRLIADALQVVDKDQGINKGPTRIRPGPRDLEGDLEGELGDVEKGEQETVRDEKEEKMLESAPTLIPQGSTPVVPAAPQGNVSTCDAGQSIVFTQMLYVGWFKQTKALKLPDLRTINRINILKNGYLV